MRDESGQQTEPGYGLYRDKDYGVAGMASNAGYWEHGQEGWRYFEIIGGKGGPWQQWERAQRYGPFTPAVFAAIEPQTSAGNTEGKPAPGAAMRIRALELAVKAYGDQLSPAPLIDAARTFEAYLAGTERERAEAEQDSDEPGLGRWADRGCDPWVHSADGWTYVDYEEPSDTTDWKSWEDVKEYGPFTKIEEN